MTAHAAQGKTRPYNVVHLNSCSLHMSYYTALSRSATAAGTIMIQGFDSRVITRGCSGYLRQEFRELELLDDITRLRYEGQLPEHIQGHLRNNLIRLYQLWKGTGYVPEKTDQALRWSDLELVPAIVAKSKKAPKQKETPISTFVPAKGSSPVKKHKLSVSIVSPSKKSKISTLSSGHMVGPLGLLWDSQDYSCSYDSLFTILYNIWQDAPLTW